MDKKEDTDDEDSSDVSTRSSVDEESSASIPSPINIIDHGEFTKKQYRWKTDTNLLLYINESLDRNCDKISDENFKQILEDIFPNVKLKHEVTIKEVYLIQVFTIHPYCAEVSQGTIDRVNSPTLQKTTRDDLQNKFQITITPEPPLIKFNGNLYISPRDESTDPANFIRYLQRTIENNRLEKKNYFIATHSNFMGNLYEYFMKRLKPDYNKKDNISKGIFDNLDIFHLIYDQQSKNFTHAIVRRYNNDYSIIEDSIDFDSKRHISVILMRHCFACHNASNYKSEKVLQFMNREAGHLSLSTCFDYTLVEMYKKRDDLIKNVFNKYGTVKTYNFGSSIILRAILTSILQKYVLDNVTMPGSFRGLRDEFDKISKISDEIKLTHLKAFKKVRSTRRIRDIGSRISSGISSGLGKLRDEVSAGVVVSSNIMQLGTADEGGKRSRRGRRNKNKISKKKKIKTRIKKKKTRKRVKTHNR
jgi:hypothetical protein